MILLTTIITGLALFQSMVSLEWYRQTRRETMEWTAINWFVMPRKKRRYMRRQEGVMTLQ